MPTIAYYLRAADERQLLERGFDAEDWIRGAVRDALDREFELPPSPDGFSYEARIRKDTRLDVMRILRDLVEEGTVLDVEAIDNMVKVIESRGP